ncbi:MAG: IS1 family transposase [Clostridium sp.]|nr:IS1 family transposase [Clostridium sp.]
MIELDINLENLNKYLNEMLKPSIYKDRKVSACPRCGHAHYIKYGFFKGIQRYCCKRCGKTFSLVTNSIWSYSKKQPSKWIEFIELMLEKRTLKYCAKELEININTAFYWRHKVLSAMTISEIPKRLVGNIHMIKTSVKENFKGNKHIDTDIREKVFVVTARGREDSILCLPVCKKRWQLDKFNEKIYKRIDPKSLILPYRDRYIDIIAKKHNKKLGINIMNKDKFDKFIGSFNLISKIWFKPFCGVATKYLKEYYCWFIIYNLRKKFININFFKNLVDGEFFIKIKEIGI